MDTIELGALDNTSISLADDLLEINPSEFNNDTVNTGIVENNFAVVDTYDGGDQPDTYQFEIGQAGTYELELSNLEANLDLFIRDSDGNILYSATASGTESELIRAELASGSYIASISGEADVTSDYSFTISQTSTEDETDGEPILNQGDTVYRFLETEAQTQFYTTSEEERDTILEDLPQYQYQGESFVGAPNPDATEITGVIPVYRFFNTNTGVHLYTTSEEEQDFITENLPHYDSEGISYYGYESEVEGSVPLYRFYNASLDAHFYTPSTAERDEFLADTSYQLEGEEEGIAYYVNPVGDI